MKLKFYTTISSLTLLAFITAAVAPIAVTAEEVGGKTTSKSSIRWTLDGNEGGGGEEPEEPGTTNPIDPEDPNIIPPDGGNDGDGGGDMTGPLTISHISGINFGLRKISGSTQVYQASYNSYETTAGDTVYVPTYIEVIDNRGQNDGWNLAVVNTPFMDSVTGDVLTGAVITLGADSQIFTQNDNGNETKVTAKGNLILDGTNAAQRVVSAEADKGMGRNTITFGAQEYGSATGTNTGVTLEVPGKTKKNENSKYVSELTWTLTQAEI